MKGEPPTQPPVARRSRLRVWIRVGLVFLAAVAAGVFLARRQIGDALAQKLDERIAAAGVFISWQSAAWVPGPGIRLQGLALYRDAAKRDRIALLSNVTALKGEQGWDRWSTVSVNTANARLTLGSGEGETTLERMDMKLLIQPGKADLQECCADLQGLRIEAKGAYARAAAAATTDPASMPAEQRKSLFGEVHLDWLKSVKEWMAFQPENEEPVLKIDFRSLSDGGGMDIAATLDGHAFQWRGQRWDFMQAAVKGSVGEKESPIEFECARIGHAGRTAEFAGSLDPSARMMRIAKFDCGIDPLGLARALAPDIVERLSAVTTTGAWRIVGEGDISLERPRNSRWSGSVTLDGDAVYASGGKRIVLQKPAFALRMEEQMVDISAFRAALWDGTLDAPMTRIHLPSAEAKSRFETQIALKGARLQSIRSSFGPAQRQPGIVQVSWKGGGGFDLASITGSGALSIREAEFYRIPLLGPLHLVFDQLTPGFGKDVASTMTANHQMAGGILRIEDLKLDSKLTRIEASGSVDMARQYAHLTAKARLQGIAGLATALLSALLELEGEGPVNNVRWKLKNIPGLATLEDATRIIGATGGAVINGTGAAVKKTTETATDAVKGTGKTLKEVLKIPGKLLPGR